MNTALLRTLVIYAVILPLAVFIGWMAVDLANWDRTSFAMIAAIIFVLLLPLLLKWHYPVLIFSWNTFITIFFLPGQPALWMLMVAINFGMAMLSRVMLKRHAFISAPSITVSLIVLALIILITAKLRGGVGIRSLGGSVYGGKGYVSLMAAILGYFALTSQPIPSERAKFYVGLFFLPSLIAVGSTLIYWAGPAFYPLFLVFPIGFAAVQAMSEQIGGARLAGLAGAAPAVISYLLAVNGLQGMLRKWWRVLLLVGVVAMGTLGGYRGAIVLPALLVAVLFLLEGLLRSPVFPAVLVAGAVSYLALIPLVSQLPLSVQRSLSVLPLKIDPAARNDAEASTEWRLQIWRATLPSLPKYFWLGKGYAIDPTELYLAEQAHLRGLASYYEGMLITGDYHSGPLSVYIPFGVFGSMAFLGFLWAAMRGLYLNYRYGDEKLKTINRFFLAYFIARLFFFFGVFGGFVIDLPHFVGLVGLNVALNKGICSRPLATAPSPVRFGGHLERASVKPGLA